MIVNAVQHPYSTKVFGKIMLISVRSFWYPIAILLFFIDICSCALFEQHIIYALLCLYCMQILRPFSIFKLSFLFLALLAEGFIYHGFITPTLCYLVPLTAVGLFMQKMFYHKNSHHYFLAFFGLSLQILVCNPVFFHSLSSLPCTILKILGIIGVMLIIP
jgi:hypothetical protein